MLPLILPSNRLSGSQYGLGEVGRNLSSVYVNVVHACQEDRLVRLEMMLCTNSL